MTKRMLIDANHPEETRVVIVDGSRVEEFDFEAASKRPLKGNIYLAKVTRVEPSLQAAFVEYGGNRQGFLAFSEIHPDYYQIPIADRQALLAEQEADARRRQEDEIESFDITGGGDEADGEAPAEEAEENGEENDSELAPLDLSLDDEPQPDDSTDENGTYEDDHDSANGAADDEIFDNQKGRAHVSDDDHASGTDNDDNGDEAPHPIAATQGDESVPEDDSRENDDAPISEGPDGNAMQNAEGAAEESDDTAANGQPLQAQRPPQKWVRRKHYKIQEVIKRRQIILVQVVKEERGNKGAALTTYLSLPGRYCVLMPNTPRGGGISRKITNAADRKRLKSAAQGLELPDGMGLIIRTAGENRTKLEIRRDYEYLLRLWDTIREKTLSSNAPACVYEEGDLIKRAIRDLYNKDVQDILVEGEGGYKNAKDFMRMLMPSHARNVRHYADAIPLFQRTHVESQLDSMFSPTVTLKSGGYIVINQTEALVAIDVNSGRATREHSIEETARKTNLEAAAEIGRQLRLRDLAGLIVIDFIDMEENRNDRDVERRLRDAVKNDRARVQIGRISQFGLLEMSRQRLRAGVVAGSTITCPYCAGVGLVRSVESTALHVLRALEEEGEKNRASGVTVKIASDVALYVLNQKRQELDRIEREHEMEIAFEPVEGQTMGHFEIERTRQRNPADRPRPPQAVSIEAGFSFADEPEPEVETETDADEDDAEQMAQKDEAETETGPETAHGEGENGEQQNGRKRGRSRRRGRRGGRRRNQQGQENPEQHGHEQKSPAPGDQNTDAAAAQSAQPEQATADQTRSDAPAIAEGEQGNQAPPRRSRRRRAPKRTRAPAAADRFGTAPDEIDTTPTDAPAQVRVPSAPVWSLQDDTPDTTPGAEAEPAAGNDSKPARKGWWQRTFSGDK